MAIKERKQITGTTAQIQSYAGHEGQIVWDKEKKTLVGMSGTAGENYPLASQTYVDTQLTEGLEGKEDKGVCLPLTGGLLSGDIELDSNSGDGNIDIGFNYNKKLGSGIGFRSINYTREPGSFSLYAQDSTRFTALTGNPDGTLTWNGKSIDSIYSFGSDYIRYTNGLQIVFAKVGIPSGGVKKYNYPVPFVGGPIVVNSQNQDENINSVDLASSTECSLRSSWRGNENNASPLVIIGRWR